MLVILASKRVVVFSITPSSTSGVTYQVQFIPKRPSLPILELQLPYAGPTSYSGLTPGTNYTLSVVAVLGDKTSSAVSKEFVTRGAGMQSSSVILVLIMIMSSLVQSS